MKAFLTILKGISLFFLCFSPLTLKKSLSSIPSIKIKITHSLPQIYEIRSSVPLENFNILSNSYQGIPNFKIKREENGKKFLLFFKKYLYGWHGKVILTCSYKNIHHCEYFTLSLKNNKPAHLFISSFTINNNLHLLPFLTVKILRSGSSSGLQLSLFSRKGIFENVYLPKVYMKKGETWRLYFSKLKDPIVSEETKEIHLPEIKSRSTFLIALSWQDKKSNEDFFVYSQNRSITMRTVEKLLSNIHKSLKEFQDPIFKKNILVIAKRSKTKQQFRRDNKKESFTQKDSFSNSKNKFLKT